MRQTLLIRARLPVVLSAALAACGCAEQSRTGAELSEPTGAETKGESFGLLDLDGSPFNLWRDREVPATVVVFTRSDCPVSNRYAPDIRRLYETFHPRGVAFYLVYVDPKEAPDDIRQHLKEYEYPCPGVRDPRHALVAHTGATATPEAVVYDRDKKMTYRGRIDDLYVELGKARAAPTRHDLADAIEATLSGRPVAEPITKAIGCPIVDLK